MTNELNEFLGAVIPGGVAPGSRVAQQGYEAVSGALRPSSLGAGKAEIQRAFQPMVQATGREEPPLMSAAEAVRTFPQGLQTARIGTETAQRSPGAPPGPVYRDLVTGRPIPPQQFPSEVQRISEVGQPVATLADVEKPHGLYTTPSDVVSPHTDLGGPRATFPVNQNAKVLTLDTTQMVTTTRGRGIGQSAGLAAIQHFLGDNAQRLFMIAAAGAPRFPCISLSRNAVGAVP